jgi:hypothetical protein
VASIKMDVDGIEDLQRSLRRFGAEGRDVMERETRKAANDVRSIAVRGIQRGPKTGERYPPVRGRRATAHTASAPGQFPATDTGRLAASIRVAKEAAAGPRTVYLIGTSLEYGRHLEFGTSEMEPRPWLAPSFREAAGRFRDRLMRAVRGLVRGR